jgi:acylphosphatase
MDRVRQHVWIWGKVQGVCFRAYTQKEARRLNVQGWVKNLQDGRVEGVFEGQQDNVVAMLKWCYQGSPWAKVLKVEHQEETYLDEEGFEIVG